MKIKDSKFHFSGSYSIIRDGAKSGSWTGLWTRLWTGLWITVEPHQESNYKADGLESWTSAILPVESSVHITVYSGSFTKST